MGNAASMLSKAAAEVNAATTAFTGANAALGRGRPSGGTAVVPVTPSPPTSTPTKQPIGLWGGWEHEKGRSIKLAKSLGTFWGLMSVWDAATALGTSAMGVSREDLIDPALRLHSIGYKTKEDKRKVERSSADFESYIRGDVKKADLMKVWAEMGSAIPHDDPTAPALTKDTHHSLMKIATAFSRLSEMTPEAGAKHLESILGAYYFSGDPETKRRMREEPGYMAHFAGTKAGQMYKAIDIFKLQGQDISEFMKYVTPSMLEKGWKFEDILTVAGLSTSTGFKANMAGRGWKTMMDVNADKLGELLLAGSPDAKVAEEYRNSKAGARKRAGFEMYWKHKDIFEKDLFGFIQNYLQPARERAEARQFNMKDFFGSNFSPQMKQWVNAETMKAAQHATNILQTQSPTGEAGIVDEYKGALDQETGLLSKSLGAEWKRFKDAIGDSGNIFSFAADGAIKFTKSLLGLSTFFFENQNHLSNGLWQAGSDAVGYIKRNWLPGAQQSRDSLESIAAMDAAGKGKTFGIGALNRALSNISDDYIPVTAAMYQSGNMSMFKPQSMDVGYQPITHSIDVRGHGEVTVTINDEGFFQRVNRILMNFQKSAGETVNSTTNSTGRQIGGARGTEILGDMF